MPGLYFLLLLVSIAGLATIDHQYKLALFYKRKKTLRILAVAMAVFIIWDILGIAANIFFIGTNNFLLGLHVGEFPVEELLFLFLLNYSTLIVYTFLKKRKQGS